MYTQVYNDEKDQDILVQLGELRTVAANFESFWHSVSSMIMTARPHVRAIVRQLENDGREAEANKIRELYQSIVSTGQQLLQEAVAILREPA